MRGPNKHYDCTSGPLGTSCRFCQLRRWRALNLYRAVHGMTLEPRPDPPKRHRKGKPCPCDACRLNREYVTGKPERRQAAA